MTRICAWCRRVLSEDEVDDDRQSHGLCPACERKHFPEEGK